ncbi:MAG: alanine racemase [Acetobacteraceae bacterium]
MMHLEDLETPVPVIALERVERNLAKMQAYCRAHDLRLRPHIKTHKMPHLARRQVELGASGITCQKLGEAEVMVEAGIEDILISFPLIGAAKAIRLAQLARRARFTVAVDNPTALETAAKAASVAGAAIGVLVEFDSGARRTGVATVAEALALARSVREASGLSFDGLMTYPSTAATAGFVSEAKRVFGDSDIAIRVVSGGGTPNAWHAHEISGLTEVRVGTYIYHDRATVAAGAASLDECALHVHATVVSRPTADRAVMDAGTKSLTSDTVAPSVGPGYGLILGYPDAVIERLNEEHGMIDLSHSREKPAVGEVLRIVPNHVCVVSNLHDEIVISRDGRVIDTWRVAARGKTR